MYAIYFIKQVFIKYFIIQTFIQAFIKYLYLFIKFFTIWAFAIYFIKQVFTRYFIIKPFIQAFIEYSFIQVFVLIKFFNFNYFIILCLIMVNSLYCLF